MTPDAIDKLIEIAARRSGQSIQASKGYLIQARLATISRREGFATLADLVNCLAARPNERFEAEIAAALTSKHTSFFRNQAELRRVIDHALPTRLKLSNSGKLRIWCAGVSTGQDAYSLAMMLQEIETGPLASAKVEIVATELSESCLKQARNGTYGHFDVQKGLSIHRVLRHFDRLHTGDWQIRAGLRDRVGFRQHNLLEPASGLGFFDIILCQNVLGDMTVEGRARAVKTLTSQLLPGAWLVTGEADRLTGIIEGLEPAQDLRGAYSMGGDPNAHTAVA